MAFGVAIILSVAVPITLLRSQPGTSLVALKTDYAPAAGSVTATATSSKPALLPSVVSVFFDGPTGNPKPFVECAGRLGRALWSIRWCQDWPCACWAVGWLAALIAGRAEPVTGRVKPETVRRLRNHLEWPFLCRFGSPVYVEAPVVIGWRRPSLVLPSDIAQHLTPEALEPLLAHEFVQEQH